jgi:uncharacterized protein
VAGELLLDTGTLVGLLDHSQSVHEACAVFFSTWTGPVVTTEAVLTESTHLLSGVHGGPQACIDFILRGGVILMPSSAPSLHRCRQLLEKYSDVPMDFADSTLVVLAEELDTDMVFTVDRDFLIYRIRGRKRFQKFPEM